MSWEIRATSQLFSVLRSASVRSFAVAIILASLSGHGIRKVRGNHFSVCTICSWPVCGIYIYGSIGNDPLLARHNILQLHVDPKISYLLV